MVYFEIKGKKHEVPPDGRILVNLKTEIDAPNAVCTVCGIGAFFASLVRLENKINGDVYASSPSRVSFITDSKGGIHFYLNGYFKLKEISLIESLFEGWRLNADEDCIYKDERPCVFVSKVSNPKDRLILICDHVIKHNGDINLNTFISDLELKGIVL
jgi:hypothetical protein